MRPFALLFSLLLVPATTFAAGTEFTLIVKDHRFQPASLTVPANTRVKLVVINQDATPEEFESHSLRREKVIPGNSQAVIFVGPLKPGTYEFYGEFNIKTATGSLLAQ